MLKQSLEAQAALFKAADSQLPNKIRKPLRQDVGKMCWRRRFKFHPTWVITNSKLNKPTSPQWSLVYLSSDTARYFTVPSTIQDLNVLQKHNVEIIRTGKSLFQS